MSSTPSAPREVAVPATLFASLRDELEKEAGAHQTVRALHYAGYHAGLAAASALDVEGGGDAFSMGRRAFWDHLAAFFATRGWGTLSHRDAHPGIGVLSSSDWAEAKTDRVDAQASCSFSAGFLSGLMSQLAGGPIAVLEIGCRSRGGRSCDFAFGSEGAIQALYARLVEGDDLDRALAAI
jgi:hypothetical protein